MNQANKDAAAGVSDTIVFNTSQMGTNTITLSQGQLELTAGSGTTTINGNGQVTVSGNNASRVFSIAGSATVAISGLTIENGYENGSSTLYNGGAIVDSGNLTLTDTTVQNSTGYAGGGIALFGEASVTLTDSTISGNKGQHGGGGGVALYGGTLNLNSSTVSGNFGYGFNGGGGISANDSATVVTLNNSTVSGNTFANAVNYFGGGGISGGGRFSITNSTIANNVASESGGAIEDFGTFVITDSTISGNSAVNSGGGIDNRYGTLTLDNTILSGNSAPSEPDVIGSITTDNGYNLLGTAAGNSTTDPNPGPHDVPSDAPKLAPLNYYGGPTQTMPPLPGSPALGAGVAVSGVTGDQRGFNRPSTNPDIGAFQTQAKPFVVTTAADPGMIAGQLSLREAINLSDAYDNNANVTFAPGLDGATIILDGAELPQVTGQVQITGPGASQVGVSGDSLSRVLDIAAGAVVNISGLTIENGNDDVPDILNFGNGGGIFNEGNLTLTDSVVSGNFAGFGGGIANYGTGQATLTDVTVNNNQAYGLAGGIGNRGTGGMTLIDCTVSGNTARGGGGFYNTSQLTVSDSTVADNTCTVNWGGGISNWTGGTATLIDSTVTGNTAAAAGGGVYNLGSANLTLTDATVTGNTAPTGGGINFGGHYSESGGTLTLADSIVAANLPSGSADINGTITTDKGHNLLGTMVPATGPGDVPSDNPMLAALGNYGGPTQTMPPLPGSPVIDARRPSPASAPISAASAASTRRISEPIRRKYQPRSASALPARRQQASASASPSRPRIVTAAVTTDS